MPDRSDDILEELKNISFLMGDVNAIRNGEYDPPRGADSPKRPLATADDIYERLGNVVGLLERQNLMLYVLGEHILGDSDRWSRATNH